MFLTVTLNPSIDKIARTDKIIIGDTNRMEIVDILPAGKGIDVSKILRQLEREVAAAGFLGGAAAHSFKKMFTAEGIQDATTPIKGETRTNIHLTDDDGNRSEFLEGGPKISQKEWDELCQKVKEVAPGCRAAALCGSAPHGVTVEMYRGLLKILKENCPIVLADASGKLLAAAIDEGVDFIKPNRLEIAGLMGKETVTNDEIIEYCRGLLEKNLGSALVSLGGEGALYISKEGVWRAQALKVDVKSTLGCGDTMVASSLISLSEKEDGATLLKKASALASANAAHPETARFDPAVYKQLLEICHVEKL